MRQDVKVASRHAERTYSRTTRVYSSLFRAAPGTLPAPTPAGLCPLPRVVIAEDDDDTRTILCELVSGLGVHVAEASGGDDLVTLLADGKPVDLLITDVRMPWITGLQVAPLRPKRGTRYAHHFRDRVSRRHSARTDQAPRHGGPATETISGRRDFVPDTRATPARYPDV